MLREHLHRSAYTARATLNVLSCVHQFWCYFLMWKALQYIL